MFGLGTLGDMSALADTGKTLSDQFAYMVKLLEQIELNTRNQSAAPEEGHDDGR